MQSAQTSEKRVLEEKIKSFYAQLAWECKDTEKNFDVIKNKFLQINEIKNYLEYNEICWCAETIVKCSKDEKKCIQLLNILPWNKVSFQQVRAPLPPLPLLHAAVAGMKFEIVDYLIRIHRINPNAINNVGETPLHIAAESGSLQQSLDMTEFLLKRGADPRIKAQTLPHHPRGERIIDYWPEKSMFRSGTKLSKDSLIIIDQAEALLNEYEKKWEEGNIVIELPPISEEEMALGQDQKETALIECLGNFRQGLFSSLKRKIFRKGDYFLVSQEDKENYLSTP